MQKQKYCINNILPFNWCILVWFSFDFINVFCLYVYLFVLHNCFCLCFFLSNPCSRPISRFYLLFVASEIIFVHKYHYDLCVDLYMLFLVAQKSFHVCCCYYYYYCYRCYCCCCCCCTRKSISLTGVRLWCVLLSLFLCFYCEYRMFCIVIYLFYFFLTRLSFTLSRCLFVVVYCFKSNIQSND